MRTFRALAASAAAVAAVGVAAPTAAAWNDPSNANSISNITASPTTVAPGGQLTVTVEGAACRQGRGVV
jgi:hypothetical protein